ncbi:enoyl-CoA delta isomerase 1, mitochondrial [Gadus chalcogrammus]|uniref:enoyl-CoA delta isomerase 1, mitochondrial n=1 Tax=Gadus chalcogrammus TaxID=1042646 RepID=UPI0024C3FBAC|nr:enoyl-CoA delta isomerase 1, mitochondrial [Gadus chalcogrammus]
MANALRRLSKCGVAGFLPQVFSRHGPRTLPHLVCQKRNNSTSSKIKVDLDPSTGVAVMWMQSPPVNSLNLDLLTEFTTTLEKLEMDKSCRGVIITSSLPKIFSAGLDILEMYQTSPEHCGEFWRAVQELWLNLYGSKLTTIAAINGSSPAGGCLVSISCDYRVMADNPRYSIGLNETLLGIVAPYWFKDTMVNTVGHRTTELALALGKLYSAPEALKIGLVDELVPEDQVVNTAAQTMGKWLAINEHARQATKAMMRKPTIDKLLSNREADVHNFVSFITQASVQKSLGMYLKMLKSRKG